MSAHVPSASTTSTRTGSGRSSRSSIGAARRTSGMDAEPALATTRPTVTAAQFGLVFNRMSPSAYLRGRGHSILYTLNYLAHLEQLGVRVVNGLSAFRVETSKALQLSLLKSLDLPFPAARVIHHSGAGRRGGRRTPLPGRREGQHRRQRRRHRPLRLAGGSRAGRRRGPSRSRHRPDRARPGVHPGARRPHHPRRGARRPLSLRDQRLQHRRELQPVPGRHLPDQRRHSSSSAPPARSMRRRTTCASKGTTPPARSSPTSSGSWPPRASKSAASSTSSTTATASRYYYDINALSNFVADAPRVVGFDPFARLADFLEAGGAADALRLLASGVRRLAAQRGRRADGADVGVRQDAGAAERGVGLRPHAHRRAEPERHQGRAGAVARRLVHGGVARGGDVDARADGGGAADVPRAGAARQAGGEHRSHQRRPAVAQRRVVVVGGGGEAVRRAVRPARRALRAHGGMARGGRRAVARAASSRSRGPLLPTSRTPSSSRSRCQRPRPTIYAGGESRRRAR